MRNILAMLLSLMLASGAAFAGDQSADASQDQDKEATTEQPAADTGSESAEDENAGDSE